MRRLVAILLLFAAALWGANVKLYLKDGDYQLVREYEVLSDRVRYYSVERSDWEELPLELVDLARTKKEAEVVEAARAAEAKAEEEESEAIRAERREIRSVPQEPGVYLIGEGKLTALKQADVIIASDKKRTILKVITPIPIVPGKSTAEIEGETSAFRVPGNRPEFYFRLSKPQRLAIVQLQKKKNARLVENITILPVANEAYEEQKQVATFKRQVGDDLFRIWPEEPLPPGEYALVEYTEGAMNLQVWDFGVGPAGKK
jgi:hypothetical protein